MLIELQDLGKSFGEHEVLKHVTASVERGDRIGIIGANGTGKTTLLRVLCGESLPDAGDAAFAAGATCGSWNRRVILTRRKTFTKPCALRSSLRLTPWRSWRPCKSSWQLTTTTRLLRIRSQPATQ